MFGNLFKKKAPPTRDDLMKALKFTDADLKANREGHMTNPQRQRLRRQQMWQALGMWTLAGFMAFTVILIGSFSTFKTDRMMNIGVMLPVAMFIGLVMLFVWMAFQYQAKTKADLHKGLVQHITGSMYRRTYVVYTGKTFVRYYELHLGGEVFKVSCRVYNAFIDGGGYDLFYAPNTKALLSADPL